MKSLIKAKKVVIDWLSSLGDYIVVDKRIKGQRAIESNELVTLEQLEEYSGENNAKTNLDNIFLEDNFFEKPVYGTDAVEEGQFVTLRQLSQNTGFSSLIITNQDIILDWQNDNAPNKDGSLSNKTFAQAYGNMLPKIQISQELSAGHWSIGESIPIELTRSGGNIDSISFSVSSLNTEILIF